MLTLRPSTETNRLYPEDRNVHDWYRFVLSFPAHLVRKYIERFQLGPGNVVLDPFCGTGTTLVECKKHGISSLGIERNPIACFASKTKLYWNVHPENLLSHATQVAGVASSRIAEDGLPDIPLPLFSTTLPREFNLRELDTEASQLLLRNSISPLPLHRTLVLLETLKDYDDQSFSAHERLALAKTIVFGISNLCFGPEVGVGRLKHDASVVEIWLENVHKMVDDLRHLPRHPIAESEVYQADARYPDIILSPNSVDAVITSPPYPNEKDYTRTTRLESTILGFVQNKVDLRLIKQDLIRSNTRGVYKADSDDQLVADHDQIMAISEAIENRRIELGKTSGFERLYARVTRLYFGGMASHLSKLRNVLRPGAHLAYVVGDQASYLRIMIRTGQILASIATSLGYEVIDIDLFRTRLATATKEQLREEVLILRWKGR
ncbi:MAG: DNA methyltransferase [Desulfomonile sp.]